MSDIIVTTVKDKTTLTEQAQAFANRLRCPYTPRQDRSLERLTAEYGHSVTVVVGEKKVSAYASGEEFFFHPSMSMLRLINQEKDMPDRMAAAMGLQPGMSVLDCTLGFATDALVASVLTGSEGRVVGIEGSPIVAALVEYGLHNYCLRIHSGLDKIKVKVLQKLLCSMPKIELIQADYKEYLKKVADNSFDVVYFDPMFRRPQEDSASMSPLRELAMPDSVDLMSVQEGCRIARKRVVLKEGRYSSEFARLGFKLLPGGVYSGVGFGVIEVAEVLKACKKN